MTDRYKGFVVHLEQDIRDDDAQEILTALRMIKRVSRVEPLVSNMDDMIAYMRGRTEIVSELSKTLYKLARGNIQELVDK